MSGNLSPSGRIECPHCEGRIKLPPGAAGERFRCPKCDAEIVVAEDGATAQRIAESDLELADAMDELGRSEPARAERGSQLVNCSRCGASFPTQMPVDEPVECPDCSLLSLTQPVSDTPSPEQPTADEPLDPSMGTAMASLLEESRADLDSSAQAPGGSEEASPTTTKAVDVTSERRSDLAQELVAKAEAELAGREHVRPELPRRPFIDGVLAFWADPHGILIALLLTVGVNIMTSIVFAIFKYSEAQDTSQVLAVFSILFLVAVGFPTLLLGFVSLWAIAHDSAGGRSKIDTWPDVNITEWLANSLYFLFAGALCAIPGYLIGQSLYAAGAPLWASMVGVLPPFLLLMPVVIPSMLLTGSPLVPLSPVVLRSVPTSPGGWLRFCLLSLGVATVTFLAVWHMVSVGFFPRLFSSALLIASLFVYARLLGRLAWVIGEHATRDEPADD